MIITNVIELGLEKMERIKKSSFKRKIPFIVGPFKDKGYLEVAGKPFDAFQPSRDAVEWVKVRIKDFKLML